MLFQTHYFKYDKEFNAMKVYQVSNTKFIQKGGITIELMKDKPECIAEFLNKLINQDFSRILDRMFDERKNEIDFS